MRRSAAATAFARRRRQQLLFAFFDGCQVARRRRAWDRRAASLRRRPARAPRRRSARRAERVGDEQDGLAAAPELRELVEALVREALVADGEHLVDQQHVGIDVNRHGEAQPHVHARRVGLDRRIDEVLELGELDDLVEPLADLALASGRA